MKIAIVKSSQVWNQHKLWSVEREVAEAEAKLMRCVENTKKTRAELKRLQNAEAALKMKVLL